jgi:hypothetical protein
MARFLVMGSLLAVARFDVVDFYVVLARCRDVGLSSFLARFFILGI